MHYEHFTSIEEIAVEKAKLLLSKKLEKGFVYPANLRFKAFQHISPLVEVMDLSWKEEKIFPFEHLMENFLIACHVAKYLGVKKQTLLELAKSFQGAPHRFAITPLPSRGVCIIDDSYNSNPMALKTVLNVACQKAKPGRLVAVLGEMKELGDLSTKAHEEIGVVCSYLVDELYCYGELTKDTIKAFHKSQRPCAHFLEKKELAHLLKQRLQKQDVVLIKGSNSNRMWEVIDFLKID